MSPENLRETDKLFSVDVASVRAPLQTRVASPQSMARHSTVGQAPVQVLHTGVLCFQKLFVPLDS